MVLDNSSLHISIDISDYIFIALKTQRVRFNGMYSGGNNYLIFSLTDFVSLPTHKEINALWFYW